MKIDGNRPAHNSAATDATRRTGKDGAVRPGPGATPSCASDRVELSGDAALHAAALKAANEAPAIRTELVDRMRHKLNAGKVGNDSLELADAIIDDLLKINAAIPNARANGSALTLEDQQATLVRRLAELVDVHVIPRQDGGADLTIGNGQPLVVAQTPYTLETAPSGVNGYAALTSQGTPVTSEITGGTRGGLLHLGDTAVPGYLSSLDTLVFETAGEINALHAAGFDLSGSAGGAFFSFSTAPVGVAGAARALGVDPAIVADNSRIAAASVAQVATTGPREPSPDSAQRVS